MAEIAITLADNTRILWSIKAPLKKKKEGDRPAEGFGEQEQATNTGWNIVPGKGPNALSWSDMGRGMHIGALFPHHKIL